MKFRLTPRNLGLTVLAASIVVVLLGTATILGLGSAPTGDAEVVSPSATASTDVIEGEVGGEVLPSGGVIAGEPSGSVSASPSASPSPTLAVSPTASPSPSVTPTASPTPSPSPTLRPTPTIEPTDSPSPSPSERDNRGKGNGKPGGGRGQGGG